MRTLKSKILIAIFFLLLILVAVSFYKQYKIVKQEPVTANEAETLSADCAVVLTGGAHRTREGIDLLAHRQIKKLIISGVHEGVQLPEIFPILSFYPEINVQDIVLERRSSSTYGNAQQSLPLIEALNCHDVMIVTSSLHMGRAYKTFRASYPENVSIIKYAVSPGRNEESFWDISTEVLKAFFYSLWAF